MDKRLIDKDVLLDRFKSAYKALNTNYETETIAFMRVFMNLVITIVEDFPEEVTNGNHEIKML